MTDCLCTKCTGEALAATWCKNLHHNHYTTNLQEPSSSRSLAVGFSLKFFFRLASLMVLFGMKLITSGQRSCSASYAGPSLVPHKMHSLLLWSESTVFIAMTKQLTNHASWYPSSFLRHAACAWCLRRNANILQGPRWQNERLDGP